MCSAMGLRGKEALFDRRRSARPPFRRHTFQGEKNALISRSRLPRFRFSAEREEKLARQTARQFVDEEILPIIEQHNREGKFPAQLVPKMAELGIFGATLKGYGCAGMSNVEYGLVMQEIERGDSAIRSFVSVQSALVMYPIHAFGSAAQKEKWLPLMQQGKAIGCFGLTEPQFGSNPGGMLTRAVKQGIELRAQRRKNVDHQRLDRRCRADLGEVRRR